MTDLVRAVYLVLSAARSKAKMSARHPAERGRSRQTLLFEIIGKAFPIDPARTPPDDRLQTDLERRYLERHLTQKWTRALRASQIFALVRYAQCVVKRPGVAMDGRVCILAALTQVAANESLSYKLGIDASLANAIVDLALDSPSLRCLRQKISFVTDT